MTCLSNCMQIFFCDAQTVLFWARKSKTQNGHDRTRKRVFRVFERRKKKINLFGSYRRICLLLNPVSRTPLSWLSEWIHEAFKTHLEKQRFSLCDWNIFGVCYPSWHAYSWFPSFCTTPVFIALCLPPFSLQLLVFFSSKRCVSLSAHPLLDSSFCS